MRIGFIVDDILEGYQRLIWTGIQKAAHQFNVQIITIPGRKIGSDNMEDKAHNLLYDFLSTDFFDGYILTATNFGSSNLTLKDIDNYFRKFNKPYVSLGVKTGDEAAVLIDNVSGLRDMINHLIRHHGYKKLGFIRGPVNNTEAKIRFDTFKKALSDSNLEINEDWIAVGSFMEDSGYAGTKKILQAKERPEVIVAANDNMLLGGFKYIQEQGLKVPEDIGLAGFDDVPATRFNPVPITTVRQPIEDLAITSVKLLLEQLTTGKKPEDFSLSTQPVYRSSCGCFSSNVEFAGFSEEEHLAFDENLPLIESVNEFLNRETAYSLDDILKRENIEIVWNTLIAFLENPENQAQSKYVNALSTALADENSMLKSYHTWNSILSTFSMLMKKKYTIEKSIRVNALIQQGYILISEKIDQIQEYNSFKQGKTFNAVQSSLQKIMQSYDLNSFITTLESELENMDFKSFYLILFNLDLVTKDQLPEESQVRMWHCNGESNIPESLLYNTKEFLPPELLQEEKTSNLMLQMITYDNLPVGLIICDCEDKPNDIYEAIRSQISTSVRTGNLINSMKNSENSLKVRNQEIQDLVLPMLEAIQEVDKITSANMVTMGMTETQIEETSKTFLQTSDSVETIADNARSMIGLIKMIDDISEQIDILSINASIESARAGEHGRGFAVISSEIRKLADSTAKNAAQTNEALQTVVKNIHVSRESSKKSIDSYTTIQQGIGKLSFALNDIQTKMVTLSEFSRSIMDIINK